MLLHVMFVRVQCRVYILFCYYVRYSWVASSVFVLVAVILFEVMDIVFDTIFLMEYNNVVTDARLNETLFDDYKAPSFVGDGYSVSSTIPMTMIIDLCCATLY